MQDEPVRRTTVRLPESLYIAAADYKARTRTDLQDIVVKALSEFLVKHNVTTHTTSSQDSTKAGR